MEVVLQEEGRQTVILSEEGTFGFISSREPERFLYDGKEEMLEKETITGSEACLYHAQPGNCGPDKNIIWRKFSAKGMTAAGLICPMERLRESKQPESERSVNCHEITWNRYWDNLHMPGLL